jgi:6-phosphogluconolactonase/glucosamine-6-phosphate isomerase/deaminase
MDLSRSCAPNNQYHGNNYRENQDNWRTQGNVTQMDNQRQNYGANGQCFNCGKEGHFARNCPKKRQQRINTNTTYTNSDEGTAVDQQSEAGSSTLANLVDIHATIAELEPAEREALSNMMGQGGGKTDFQTA